MSFAVFSLSSGISSLSRKSKMRYAEAEAVCMFVMPCAICVSGEVKSRTYRMNETITPNSIVPFIARIEPRTHTAT